MAIEQEIRFFTLIINKNIVYLREEVGDIGGKGEMDVLVQEDKTSSLKDNIR